MKKIPWLWVGAAAVAAYLIREKQQKAGLAVATKVAQEAQSATSGYFVSRF